MKLYALITARCLSGRFPNKVISMLGGRPMLEQIIMKAKNLRRLDGIVVSTSYLTYDNPIQDICEDNHIECYRGDNDDLASRHLETWNTYGMTHALTLSGDSPFFDLEMAQRIIDKMREEPAYWTYGAYSPLGVPVSGHMVGGVSRNLIDAQVEAYRKCNNQEEIQECYAQAYIILPGDLRICLVDCSDIMPPTKTAMKIDIDYPLEMAVMNKVIDHLGFFPERYEDIEKAYKEIVRL